MLIAFAVLDLLAAGAAIARNPGPIARRPGVQQVANTRPPSADLLNRVYVPVAQVSTRIRRPAPQMAARPAVTPPPVPTSAGPAYQARIEIVWPHGGASVSNATLANVTAYLTAAGGGPLPCDAEPVVRLWRALNAEPAVPVAVGTRRMHSSGGQTFPVWDFNDVDVSEANAPGNRLLFFATVDGAATLHNIWVHATDARTVFPQADQPASATGAQPAVALARLEILWLHDDLPIEQARQANLTAYLFDAADGQAFAPGTAWNPQVRLHYALNNDVDGGPAQTYLGTPRAITTAKGLRFLAWDFNDVDVGAARDSLNKLHFWVSVDGVPTLTSIWTHGASAPTIHPQADVMASCR